MESNRAATSGSGTLLPERLPAAPGSLGARRSPGLEAGTLGTLRERGRQLGLAPPVQRPPLEGTREHDLGFRREHVRNLLDPVQSPFQMAGVGGSHLEQIVGFAGEVMALLDLADFAEIARQVRGNRTRDLLDEDEREDAVTEQGWVRDGDVAFDDPAGLELLHSFVGGRPAHAYGLPDVGEGFATVPL